MCLLYDLVNQYTRFTIFAEWNLLQKIRDATGNHQLVEGTSFNPFVYKLEFNS